jgi:hypothetical protein
MEKVIRDGKVAVLVSRGFGAGWSTWNREYPELVFHPKVVELVELGKKMEILDDDWIKENMDHRVYTGGVSGLEIVWLSVGTRFRIDEYDGSESIITQEDLDIIA